MVFLMISGTLALLFTSQFAYVFLLGIQQVNVHKGYRLRAFLNSFGIGLCQIAALWFIPHARTFTEFAVFLIAGPVGIVAMMIFYPVIKK